MILNLYPFFIFFAIPALLIDFFFLPLVFPTFWIDLTYNAYLLLDTFINALLSPVFIYYWLYVVIAAMAERPMYRGYDVAA